MALVTTNMFHSGIRAGVLSFLELVQDMLHPDQHSSSKKKKKKKASTKAAIESMPRVTITAKEDCSICLEKFKVGGEAREMPCNHRFHSGCIENWLWVRKSCPLCRFLIPLEELEEEESGGEL